MTEEKSPLDQALDLFFYAPLGLLMNAEEIVPQLIEKGHQQVTMARMFGQFAVQQGQTEAGKVAARVQEQAMSVAEQLNQLANRQRPAPVDHAAGPAPSGNGAANGATQTSAPVARPQHDNGKSAALAITDYDSLSASQVVPRLDGLSPEELEAVREYEAGHRGRKTILSKIDQLRA